MFPSFLVAPLSNPRSPRPLSPATQLPVSVLLLEQLSVSVCVCVCTMCVCLLSLLYCEVGADACVNSLWAGMKLRNVVLNCKCLFPAESSTLFTYIRQSFSRSIQAAIRTIHRHVYLKHHVI